jgi:bifunctional DNase/RNase
MVVTGLTIDPANNAPIVILRDDKSGRVLPIWIGVIEASAIAFELEKVQLSRPMTHDLLRTAIEALGGAVQRVLIVDLRDNTYYAQVVLTQAERVIEIDARPSDAIALALRVGAPIFCDSVVIERALARKDDLETAPSTQGKPPVKVEHAEADSPVGPRPLMNVREGSMKELLEKLSPEDFGKYKM